MSKGIVISDVDGCLTDGKYIYTEEGKVAKMFGPHDNDGVKLLRKSGFDVVFISADKRGFPITMKRIGDMNCNVFNVSEDDRVAWVNQYIRSHGYKFSVFFGDGIGDVMVKNVVDVFVVPNNARKEAKQASNYITESNGGDGAFLDLALYVIENYTNIDETTK